MRVDVIFYDACFIGDRVSRRVSIFLSFSYFGAFCVYKVSEDIVVRFDKAIIMF